MKVAIISDVHGNLTALQAVLPVIGKEADKAVCLGDVAATGPQPHETIALLKELDIPCVLGNTDESLWKGTPDDFRREGRPTEEVRRMEALDRWTRSQITSSDRKMLSSFKPTITLKLGGSLMLCYHGSPNSNTQGILPTTPDEELSRILSGAGATIFAGGHTHSQMMRRWRKSLIINPGSVGLPFEKGASGKIQNPAWAEYAMVTRQGGDLKVELRRTKYSLSELSQAVRSSGMPDTEWWLTGWV